MNFLKSNILKLTTILLLFLPGENISIAQKSTVFYNDYLQEVSSILSASYYRIDSLVKNGSKVVEEYQRLYSLSNGQLYSEDFIQKIGKSTFRRYRQWHTNTKLRKEINFKDDDYHGDFIVYWSNGNYKRKDHYQDGVLTGGTCYNRQGDTIPYYEPDKVAEFPGGFDAFTRYLTKELKYPKEDMLRGISGTVIVGFTIEEDGRITYVEIIQSVSPALDAEAMRFVSKMPAWTPSTSDGKPTRTHLQLPLVFSTSCERRDWNYWDYWDYY